MEESQRTTNQESHGSNDYFYFFCLLNIFFSLKENLNMNILIQLVDKLIINNHHFYAMGLLIVHTRIMRVANRETQRPLSYIID